MTGTVSYVFLTELITAGEQGLPGCLPPRETSLHCVGLGWMLEEATEVHTAHGAGADKAAPSITWATCPLAGPRSIRAAGLQVSPWRATHRSRTPNCLPARNGTAEDNKAMLQSARLYRSSLLLYSP